MSRSKRNAITGGTATAAIGAGARATCTIRATAAIGAVGTIFFNDAKGLDGSRLFLAGESVWRRFRRCCGFCRFGRQAGNFNRDGDCLSGRGGSNHLYIRESTRSLQCVGLLARSQGSHQQSSLHAIPQCVTISGARRPTNGQHSCNHTDASQSEYQKKQQPVMNLLHDTHEVFTPFLWQIFSSN